MGGKLTDSSDEAGRLADAGGVEVARLGDASHDAGVGANGQASR